MTGVTVADYLARRLHAAGVRHVFGVPGDFTLGLNDALNAGGLIEWVGMAGELGAGYAADGYARRRGLAALVTTYGVGELSCLGAVAGAYAEHVPVLQITGSPPTAATAAGAFLHHTLGDGDHGHFARAYREVTVACETLTPADPAGAVDRVITAVRTQLRPGYLSIPADLVTAEVDPARLGVPIAPEPSDPGVLAEFTAAARRLLGRDTAGRVRPVLVAGHVVQRLNAQSALATLAEAGGLPTVVLLESRGVLDEGHPEYRGLYMGAMSDPEVRAVVDTAPVMITLGVQWSDVVSGFFSHRTDSEHTIALDVTSATVGGRVFDGVRLTDALAALTSLVSGQGDGETRSRRPECAEAAARPGRAAAPDPADDAPLTQAGLWAAVQAWLPAGTTLVTDIGTAFWGAVGLRLPPDTEFVAQSTWSAIGYALPATLGATLASPDRRPVLITGEGAAMMTAQELGTLAARAPGAIVVVIDNGGYTIERVLRSPKAPHHDVARWDWTAFARAVAPLAPPFTRRAATGAQLVAALAEAERAKDRLSVIHAVVGSMDTPPLLQALAAAVNGGPGDGGPGNDGPGDGGPGDD
jgi:indolepyruvate decarboxylase